MSYFSKTILTLFLCSHVVFAIKAQTSTLNIKPYGIQFKDGTTQSSAIVPLNNGSSYEWIVYLEYSNGITGGSTTPGFEDHSKVLKVHHEIYQDLNQNGIPNGVKHHRALMISKDIDEAGPDLYQVYDNNSTLDSLSIKYTRMVQNGTFPEKFRITLYNVKIKEINTHLAYDNSTNSFQGEESLFLIYQSMEVRHFNPNDSYNLNYQY